MSELENPITETIKQKLSAIPNIELKLNEQKEIFKNSDAIVICENCAVIFYSGLAKTIIEEKQFVDWKMLSFRHVWDTKHKVVIFMSYFALSKFPLSPFANLLDPRDNTKIRFWINVEQMRQRFIEHGDKRAFKNHDKNWCKNAVCFCSTCRRKYYNPKDACCCCYGTKPWMPFSEVDTIGVKIL